MATLIALHNMEDFELKKQLAARFEKADPLLYKACQLHFDTMKASMNEMAQREMDAIQARERWKNIALGALDRAQELQDKINSFSHG